MIIAVTIGCGFISVLWLIFLYIWGDYMEEGIENAFEKLIGNTDFMDVADAIYFVLAETVEVALQFIIIVVFLQPLSIDSLALTFIITTVIGIIFATEDFIAFYICMYKI